MAGKNYRKFNDGGNAAQAPAKKRSGASFGYAQGEAGRPYVRGWRVSKRTGLTSFIGGPFESANNKTKTITSKSGFTWQTWSVKVQPENAKAYFVWGLFCEQTKKLIIRELGLVLNPKAPNGGFCGRFGTK